MSEPIVGLEVPGPLQSEKRFFQPTARCPHPERWHATDGDSTEHEVARFIGALVVAMQVDVVVETGSAFGETTERLVAALERNCHGHLYTLETDPARAAYVRERIAASDSWTLVEESSLSWVPPAEPKIDLLFSDTAREIRCQEILRFRPWMRQGAIAAVHDSGWDMGPLRGWLENSIVKPGLGRAIDLPTARGLTLLEINPGHGG